MNRIVTIGMLVLMKDVRVGGENDWAPDFVSEKSPSIRLTYTARRSKSSVGGSAFTLIELLVTIAIIAILAAIIVPAVGRAGFRSKVARCTNNMRQLGIACANYASEGQNVLPSFPLPTKLMSNFPSINPTMVSFETLSSLDRFGVTPQMWFCPTRKRWDIYQTTSKHARGA